MRLTKMLLSMAIMFVVVTSASADDNNPYERSVIDLAELSIERVDPLFMGRACLRCAALNRMLLELFTRDFPKEDLSSYEDAATDLLTVGLVINRDVSRNRGIEGEALKAVDTRTLEETSQYVELYSQWMTENYDEQGEYFGSSPSFQLEIQQCNEIVSLVREIYLTPE